MKVSTFYGNVPGATGDENKGDPRGAPHGEAQLVQDGGVRLLLARPGQELSDGDVANILIERRPGGWALIVHPDDGDAVAMIAIDDEGRTFIELERLVSESAVRVIEDRSELPPAFEQADLSKVEWDAE